MDISNFGWNVAVEFIGLAVGVPVTIYVIDRLIKRREGKRWRIFRGFVKSDALLLTYDIVTSVAKALRRGSEQKS